MRLTSLVRLAKRLARLAKRLARLMKLTNETHQATHDTKKKDHLLIYGDHETRGRLLKKSCIETDNLEKKIWDLRCEYMRSGISFLDMSEITTYFGWQNEFWRSPLWFWSKKKKTKKCQDLLFKPVFDDIVTMFLTCRPSNFFIFFFSSTHKWNRNIQILPTEKTSGICTRKEYFSNNKSWK